MISSHSRELFRRVSRWRGLLEHSYVSGRQQLIGATKTEKKQTRMKFTTHLILGKLSGGTHREHVQQKHRANNCVMLNDKNFLNLSPSSGAPDSGPEQLLIHNSVEEL